MSIRVSSTVSVACQRGGSGNGTNFLNTSPNRRRQNDIFITNVSSLKEGIGPCPSSGEKLCMSSGFQGFIPHRWRQGSAGGRRVGASVGPHSWQ